MPKKYLNFSIVLAIVVIGGLASWYFFNKNKEKDQVVKAMPQEVTVILRDDGFDPATITIDSGTSVRWINNTTSVDASISSDDFPTNRLYPELNLGKFAKDQSLSHIFTKSGKYTYHDHFHPERKGTVEVR